MHKRKICAGFLSLALSCQLLIAPLGWAEEPNDAINNIIKDQSYTNLVNQLMVDASVVENFVQDVVKELDSNRLDDENYIKGIVTKKLITNESLSNAILSLSDAEYNEAKKTVITLGNKLVDELQKDTATPGAPGGGGGGPIGGNNNTEVVAPVENLEQVINPDIKRSKEFADIVGHWAANDIQYMVDKGFVNGVGDGKFQPQSLVTRAEIAAMLSNVLSLQEQAVISFKDVSEETWYYSSVARAYKAGLAKGKGPGYFDPEAPITRQELAAMIANAMKYKGILVQTEKDGLNIFLDSSMIADWAKQSAAEVHMARIIKGKPTNNGLLFAPNDNTTRAEATVMLKNFLDAGGVSNKEPK